MKKLLTTLLFGVSLFSQDNIVKLEEKTLFVTSNDSLIMKTAAAYDSNNDLIADIFWYAENLTIDKEVRVSLPKIIWDLDYDGKFDSFTIPKITQNSSHPFLIEETYNLIRKVLDSDKSEVTDLFPKPEQKYFDEI